MKGNANNDEKYRDLFGMRLRGGDVNSNQEFAGNSSQNSPQAMFHKSFYLKDWVHALDHSMSMPMRLLLIVMDCPMMMMPIPATMMTLTMLAND